MEHIKKLIGQKIYLSPLQAEDAPQLCRWRNDLSMTQQLGSPTQLSSIESEVERDSAVQQRGRTSRWYFLIRRRYDAGLLRNPGF